MSTPKLWTVEEANAILPRLSLLIGEQFVLADEIGRGARRLREMIKEQGGARSEGSGSQGLEQNPSAEARALEGELRERMLRYDARWREIEGLGVVVKDPRSGLCDFYGRVDGRLVWLCWRYGEQAIEHYHALDAGFAGRKRLDGPARHRLLN